MPAENSTRIDTEKYLQRINYKGDASPTMEVLAELQKAHLLSVPFENLDIHLNRKIELNVDKIYQKIVLNNRGGFCYELNGLYYEFLKSIGFNVSRISARVYDEQTGFGKEFDHLAILVHFDKIDYLADVGFGEFTIAPLMLVPDIVQKDENGVFKIEKINNHYQVCKIAGEDWKPEYLFSLTKRNFGDFAHMCNYHQTSPESHFTTRQMCSLATNQGRITLTKNKLKITKGTFVIEEEINEKEFDGNLWKYFKIKLDGIPAGNGK